MKSSKNDLKTAYNKEPTIGKMLMFSMGYFFSGYLIVSFGSFVWHYYESELGLIGVTYLWPIFLAILNIIYTVFSMVTNPLIGYFTDKPMKWTKKRGYHTPWVIIGGFPASLLFFLFFLPRGGGGIESVLPILIYYLIIICLYDFTNSLYQTHSFGAFPAHFRGDKTRRIAGTITQIFIFIANFIGTTIWSQFIIPGKASSFTFAAFLSFIILVISLIIFIPGAKESEEMKNRFIVGYETSERRSFFKIILIGIKQKNFMLAIVSYISFMVALGLMSMNTVNFVDDVLQESQSIRSISSLIMLISSLVTIPIWIRVARKIGHSNTYVIGLIFFGCSFLANLFINNAIQYFIISLVSGMGAAMFTIMLSPVFADCYDEFTVKVEKHIEATLMGVRNFFLKISVIVQSFIVALIHSFTYYDPNTSSHSGIALFGLRMIQGFFPFLICVTGAIIFYIWFDLKGEKKREMAKKLHDLGL
ncbi:MAG: MFS transporter [Promethearchaeota archaeon]